MYGVYVTKGPERPRSANPTHRALLDKTSQRPYTGIIRAPIHTCEQCVKLFLDIDDLEQENKQLKKGVERMLKDRETKIWNQISSTLDELYKENCSLKKKLATEGRNRMWGNRNIDYDEVESIRNRYYTSLDENAHLERLLEQKEHEVWDLKNVIADKEARGRRLEWERNEMKCEMKQRKNELELNFNHSLQQKDSIIGLMERRCLELIQENENLKEINNINKRSLFSSLKGTQRVNELNYDLRKAEAENEELNKKLEKAHGNLFKEKMGVNELHSSLREVKAENLELREKLNHTKTENEQLLRRLNSENKMHSIWAKKENEDFKKQIDDLVKEKERLVKQKERLVKEKECLLKSNADIKQQQSTKNDQYQNLLAEMERLKRKEISTATEMKKMRDNLVGKDIEIERLRRQLSQRDEKESANLFKEKEELLKRGFAVDYELKKVQTELQKKQAVVQQLQERNKEKEKEVEALMNAIQKEIEEKEKFKQSNKQLQDDLYQLRDKIKDLEKGRIKFTLESNRSTDTEKEIDQLRLKVRNMEHEMARREWSRSNDTDKELDRLRTKVQDMEKEKAGFTRQLNMSNDSEKELAELRVKLKNMEEEKSSLVQQLKKSFITEKELIQLRTNAENMKDENARLARQLNKSYGTEEELQELRAKVNEMELDKARLAGQLNRSNDTEKELSELRIKVKSMEEEKGNLAQRLKNSNYTEKELGQLQASIKNMGDENARLKRQLKKLEDYNEELKMNMSEITDLRESNKKLTAENRQLQSAHVAVSKERDDLEARNFRAEEKLKDFIKEIGEKNEEIQRLQIEVKNLQRISRVSENEHISVKTQMDRLQEKISQLSNENSNLRKENVDVSRQKEDALERLSRLAGAKLTHGNAAITDLSDTDRPTKIAEKFSELYDNAWTDAFEELDTTYHNETETINVLLKILQEAYTFCVQTEKDYEDRINRAVFTLADDREITSADVAVQKALADLRISLGNPCCSVIEEMFLSRLPSLLRDLDVAVCPKTKIYARQCASLCWRMRIREPPVFVRFEFRKGTTFNADVLRKFTKTGGYLDFLVWPALYLHENGPLLAKGVAQPKLTP